MVSRTIAAPVESEGQPVGQVFIDLVVENLFDVYGGAPQKPQRTVSLRGVLMDTGATHLCLPANVIEELALPFSHSVPVQTPLGIDTRRIFTLARLRYEDRRADGQCVELPVGSAPLLGAIPMEVMGIEPDFQNRRVRKLPLGPDGTYITA